MTNRIVECNHVIVCDCGVHRENTFLCQSLFEGRFFLRDIRAWLDNLEFCETCHSNWRIFRKLEEPGS